MLFGDADGSPDELGREKSSQSDQEDVDVQHSAIGAFPQGFMNELHQAASHASQVDIEEIERIYGRAMKK
jgi:hypothetical protein